MYDTLKRQHSSIFLTVGGKHFLDMTPNINDKREIDKLYFTIISKCQSIKTLLKIRQVANWEKYSQYTYQTKDFYLEYEFTKNS